MIDYLRLAFGTTIVLLPGVALSRALGQRTVSAVFAWSLGAAFVAWAIVFTAMILKLLAPLKLGVPRPLPG